MSYKCYHFYFQYTQKFDLGIFLKYWNRRVLYFKTDIQQFLMGFNAHIEGRSRNDPVRQISVRKQMIASQYFSNRHTDKNELNLRTDAYWFYPKQLHRHHQMLILVLFKVEII